MKGKKEIEFTCYASRFNEGLTTLFLFYPQGVWDEDKLTLEDALNKYPVEEYEWVYFSD